MIHKTENYSLLFFFFFSEVKRILHNQNSVTISRGTIHGTIEGVDLHGIIKGVGEGGLENLGISLTLLRACTPRTEYLLTGPDRTQVIVQALGQVIHDILTEVLGPDLGQGRGLDLDQGHHIVGTGTETGVTEGEDAVAGIFFFFE